MDIVLYLFISLGSVFLRLVSLVVNLDSRFSEKALDCLLEE